MATFQEHLQYIAKHSVARTNRFQVIIPLPAELLPKTDNKEDKKSSSFFGQDVIKYVSSFLNGPEITRGLEIMLESTDIPGKSLTTTEVKYNGDYYKLPYANVYETQQFVFKCSKDMYEKNIIDEWMKMIFDPTTHAIGYMDDYVSNITINQLDEQNQVVYSVILKDSYPSLCAPITVSNEDKDNFARLQVQFMYRRWQKAEEATNTIDGVTSLSQTPFGPILAPVLSNPAVQRALSTLENQTGLNLEGEAVNIYNQVDAIVKSTTGSSTNQSAGLIESIKAQVSVSGTISELQKSSLIGKIDDVLTNLRS
jgi:hypothetical protein